MKLLPLAVASLVIMTGCSKSGNNNNVDNYQPGTDYVRDSLQQQLADQDSVIALMTEISDAMQQIKSMEGLISQSGDELTNRRQQLRNDMQLIQQSIIKNRERLAQLEQRLAKSNSNNAQLKRAVISLKNQIAAQELTISGLRSDLAAANIQIEELTNVNDSLTGTVNAVEMAHEEALRENYELRNEMNKAYYVVGSKKELKNHNIIETGFMRKTKLSPSDYELTYFTAIDRRMFNTLPLHSKKAEVMSNHNKNSYTITSDENGMKTLNITDPDLFWATSNFLVVKTD